jgi:predicted dehydrogenase
MTRFDKISRRRFLKTSTALAAAGASAPMFIPSGAPASPSKPGANDRIGVGYIGMGRRASQLLGLPKVCQIVAVADINRANADSFAAKHNCEAYKDYRQLLDSKDVDAVVIATPDHWHALHSIHACQAGKDVYVEKPMTLTIREGRLMVEAARKYGRIVQVGSQQRSMAANRVGCELVRTGKIGKITEIIAYNYPSPWECKFSAQPVPEGLDWDAWCGQTEVVPFNKDIYVSRSNPGWISLRPWSGGEMTGWGAHGLDQVQWALGMDESGPVETWTEGEKFDPPVWTDPAPVAKGNAVCNHPMIFMRYANGAVLRLEKAPMGGAIFIGDKGKITLDRGVCRVEPEELSKELLGEKPLRDGRENHLGNWVDCIKSRRKPVGDVEIGHRSTTVCHLGNIARWAGRKLQWDPVKEQFVGDEEANKYLTRPQRKPYQIPDPV